MNKKLLIDYYEVRNLFNEEFKQTMQLIEAGETHLDNLAEGFTEADRVLFRLMFLHPQTNADRIRAMSDEELAVFICDRCSDCSIEVCPGADMCNGRDGRSNGLVKWLKQPVKDGDNDG